MFKEKLNSLKERYSYLEELRKTLDSMIADINIKLNSLIASYLEATLHDYKVINTEFKELVTNKNALNIYRVELANESDLVSMQINELMVAIEANERFNKIKADGEWIHD